MKIRFILILMVALIVAACQPEPAPLNITVEPVEVLEFETPEPTAEPTPEPDPLRIGTNGSPWWNDVVFYQIFVRSFYDSDGDGVGDINGIIEQLDYLNDGDPTTTDDLGVTGIWLMPIAVSPSYHGYDVVDYFQVDPEYGTNEDFLRLMDEAHARGIRIIVDFVVNHTASDHPWFLESQDPDSDKRDWYVWADENPNYRGPDGQVVWHGSGESYFYGVFWEGMPDLNYENPDVTAAMFEAVEFWLTEMGVDGFRLDAIKYIVEEGQAQENTGSTHDWLKEFHAFYKEIDPTALTVGEAWTNTQQVLEYTGDEADINFEFFLAEDFINSAGAGLGPVIAKTQTGIYESFPPNQYATFLRNHDQNRTMSQLRGEEAHARVAASMLLTGPGVPFVYYGDEIGMTGLKASGAERDIPMRRPMQWTSEDANVGFTTGEPWWPAAEDYPERSVALQDDDPNSLLSHYRSLIHLRNEHEALRVGDWTLVEPDSGRLYVYLRHTENETLLVIINLNRNSVRPDQYALSLEAGPLSSVTEAVSLFGMEVDVLPEVTAEGGFAEYIPFAEDIPPHSTHIIQLVTE